MQKHSNLNTNEIYIEVIQLDSNLNDTVEIYKTILFSKINPFELIEYNPSESKIRYIKCPGQSIILVAHINLVKKVLFEIQKMNYICLVDYIMEEL